MRFDIQLRDNNNQIFMKTKTTLVFSTIFAVSAALFPVASAGAVSLYTNTDTKANVEVKSGSNTGASAEVKDDTETDIHRNSTSTVAKENEDDHEGTTTEEDDNGEINAEAHRSIVSAFVHSLLNVADREGGIGAEVRVVAHSQNDSASTTADAITKVEGRNHLKVLLFGSDYHNLGILRSEIATTTNNINHLKNLLSAATNADDRATLSAQITALETTNADISAFVTAHENMFSFFGWFTKLFSK